MLSTKIIRLSGGLLVLVPVCALAYWLAFLLRFDGSLEPQTASVLGATIVWAVGLKVISLVLARLHREYTRYVTFRDMLVLVRSVTASSIALSLVDSMLLTQLVIPRSVILLDWGVTLSLLAALRIAPRLIRDQQWRQFIPRYGTPALIVGANDAGEALLRSIRCSPKLNYQVIGFIDDRREVWSRQIAGVPVLGGHDDVPGLARQHQIEEVLITAGSLPGREVRALLELSNEHKFRVKVLPSYVQLLDEQVAINPRPVAIVDLLRRPSVQLDTASIRQWIDNRTVLVTGSAGSIGSEICRQLLTLSPARLVIVDRSETGQFFLERELRKLAPHVNLQVVLADLNDRERVDAVFDEFTPDIIFHAAAYKHVPLMEAHVGEAVKNIVLATRNLVDMAEKHQAEGFVMISTDKAVNPTSVMGSCKRLAEQYVEAKASASTCRMVTVRFGNVLDSAGSVVPIFRQQIAGGGPVTVTHPDMVRYFMLIPEAAQLVIQAGTMGQGGEIFVLDMGEPVRIRDLAEDMIRLSGFRVGEDIEVDFTGLRPGEKLYEELYSDQEENLPTRHEKIMVAQGKPRSLLEVISDINQLAEIANQPNEAVRQLLHQIIPVLESQETLPAATRRAA